MSNDYSTFPGTGLGVVRKAVMHELQHLRNYWWCFLILGIFLVISGVAAIIVPAVTVWTTFAATIVLGALLLTSGIATIASAFWAGKWSGFLVQLLVGIVYLAAGVLVMENPAVSAVGMTLFISTAFIIVGAFRIVGALVVKFPQWGWALVNGIITLAAGIMVFRHLPADALWVIGLLVGLEMLFNGWTWMALALFVRKLTPAEIAHETTGTTASVA